MVEVLGGDAGHREGALAGQPGRRARGQILHLRHHHVLGGLAEAAHVDRRLGAVLGPICARQHHRAARVGDEADIEQVERVGDRARVEHVGHRDRIAEARLRIERRPLPGGDRDLGPLLERGAVLVHVARGDHAEVAAGPAEAVGELELPAERGVTGAGDPGPRAAGLSVRDDRDIAEAVVQGGHRVPHHDDEGAAAHRGAVHVARLDAEGLAERGGGVLARGEDAVDVLDLEARVADRVRDRLEMQRELARVRQGADLVALVHAHDAGGVAQFPLPVGNRGHGAHRLGWNSGRVTSSLTLVNTTSTGMSHLIAFGEGSTLIRFDIMRGPSSSSIMAST